MADGTSRVALVTGAGRGQGRSHALALARAGVDIVGIDICRSIDTVPYDMASLDDLKATATEVEKLGRRFVTVEGDVRSSADLEGAVAQANEEFGRLDILVANAGIWALAPLWQMTEAQWQDMIDVNLTGVWRTLRAVIPTTGESSFGSRPSPFCATWYAAWWARWWRLGLARGRCRTLSGSWMVRLGGMQVLPHPHGGSSSGTSSIRTGRSKGP